MSETANVVDANGDTVTTTRIKTVPVTTPFDPFCEFNKKRVRETLERAYAEQRVQPLAIKWRPNMRKWLRAFSCLFFNVKDVKATVKSTWNFVHALRDKSHQTMLYLYSDKSGGTGKTWLGEQLKWYFNSHVPGGKANTVTDIKDGFINPSDFNAHMVFLDDFNPNSVEIETLNNLIDHHEMSYNIKFGPKGRFTNDAVIAASSNYLPKNINTRRWSVIEYNSWNVGYHIAQLDPEKVHQAVVDLIECCPLKLDFSKLESPDVSCLNYELLQYIIDNAMRIPSRIIDFVDGD